VIAGGSGFLGRSLIPVLIANDFEPVVFTRSSDSVINGVRHVQWDAKMPGPWSRELDGAYAVVNVVGRTVDCRKTAANKRVILASRVDSVNALAAAFANLKTPPKVWIQSATAHIFGDTGDEILDERSPIGTGFAPEVGTAWEAAFDSADIGDCRPVLLRISFVLGRNGGAFRTLSLLTKMFMGGATGSGRQWMSWLHEADLNALILRALTDARMSGMYVATAPEPLRNDEFMKELRRALHRPWSPRVPEAMVRIGALFMRTDPELAIYGRRIVPTRLLAEGFQFRHRTLPEALANLIT